MAAQRRCRYVQDVYVLELLSVRRRFSVLYEYKETVIYGFFFLKKITKNVFEQELVY